jgi:hypothetical protein
MENFIMAKRTGMGISSRRRKSTDEDLTERGTEVEGVSPGYL